MKNEEEKIGQIYLNLQYDDVERIVAICRAYRDWFDIDLKFGRYVIDGCSYLGAFSISNHIVQVCPVPDTNEKIKKKLYKQLKPYGAYLAEDKNEKS